MRCVCKHRIVILLIILFSISFLFSKSIYAATYYTDTQKQLIRDTNRLSDLTKLKNAIESYKSRNGYYPKLNSGTYIKGYVNSVWSSEWSNFCSLINLSPCPKDPINEIVNCNCSIFGPSCDSGDLNTLTCYSPKLAKFACTKDSHIYEYQVLNNGLNYAIRMNLEYSQNVDWRVESTTPDNIISVTGNCNNQDGSTIVSGSTPICGNRIIEYGEACDGNSRIDFCTLPNGELGRKVVQCASDCRYNDPGLYTCLATGFCGDNIIQSGEECDGGSQSMCFNYSDVKPDTSDPYTVYSKYNWYNEQYRYCNLNCKYDRAYIESTAYCGGYCGDGIIQGEYNEECDSGQDFAPRWSDSLRRYLFCSDRTDVITNDPSDDSECLDDPNCQVSITTGKCENIHKEYLTEEKHCNMSMCRYKNNAPSVIFDFFDNPLSNNTYIKSSVWSGQHYEYGNDYFNSGNIDLVPAQKQGDYFTAIYNSDFIQMKFNATDPDNDILTYKYELTQTYNSGIKIQYYAPDYTFHDYTEGTYIGSNIIRLLPTDNNLKNINNKNLFGSNYIGFYKIKVTVNDNYYLGQDSMFNPHYQTGYLEIPFKIGPGCGDRILEPELGEVCEFKAGNYLNNIYMNWGTYIADVNGVPTAFPQPDNDGNCVMMKFNVLSDNFDWKGTFDNVDCNKTSYFICEKRTIQNCTGFITGQNDNCYKLFTTSRTYNDAEAYCESIDSHLLVIDDEKEFRFIKNNSNFNSYQYFWIGYKRDNASSPFYALTGGKYDDNNKSYALFDNKIYSGGSGTTISNNYSCGLPWENAYCSNTAGYCGDNMYSNEFEECDRSDKTSFGRGTSIKEQYYCGTGDGINDNNPNNLTCRDEGGYCGDAIKQTSYEHCEPKIRITAANSRPTSYGLNQDHQYLCKKVDDANDVVYNDYNDYEANKNKDSNNSCRKSFGGYCGDGNIQLFYQKDANNSYVSMEEYTQSDTTWKSLVYKLDEGVYKYLGNNLTSEQKDLLAEECDPTNYICDSGAPSNQCILPKNSSIFNEYGGCGPIEETNSDVVFPCFKYMNQTNSIVENCVGSCYKSGNNCITLDANTCVMVYKRGPWNPVNTSYGYGLIDYTGNCGCKKIKGGFCGDSILQDMFSEECDPELIYYANGKLFGYGSISIAENSSYLNQYLCGRTTRYSESIADLNKYDQNGNIIATYVNEDKSDMSCNIFGGYCGDGVDQADYNKKILQSDKMSLKTYSGPYYLEECDPKNFLTKAESSSQYNSYTCGSVGTSNACKDLGYGSKDPVLNRYGGYCGDGKIQYDLTKQAVDTISQISGSITGPEDCDPRAPDYIGGNSEYKNPGGDGVLNSDGYEDIRDASSINRQYLCGLSGPWTSAPESRDYYKDYLVDGDISRTLLKSDTTDNFSENNLDACQTYSGYCKDGFVQPEFEDCDDSILIWDVNKKDNEQNWCYKCLQFNCNNIPNQKVYLIRSGVAIKRYDGGATAVYDATNDAINNDLIYMGDGYYTFPYNYILQDKTLTFISCKNSTINTP